MEKKGVKFLSILLLSLFIASIFLSSLSFVSAQSNSNNQIKQFIDSAAGNFGSVFTQWSTGEGVRANVAKIFLLVMIWLIVFLIMNSVFGTYSPVIMNLLSFIVAFLATAYITPAEFFGILQSYSALGLTIASLVPFAILLTLTYRAASADRGQVQLILLQLLAWVFFVVYLFYKVVLYIYNVYYDIPIPGDPSGATLLISSALLIIAALLVAFNGRIVRTITRRFVLAQAESADSIAERAARYERSQARAARTITGGRGRTGGP